MGWPTEVKLFDNHTIAWHLHQWRMKRDIALSLLDKNPDAIKYFVLYNMVIAVWTKVLVNSGDRWNLRYLRNR